MSEREIYRHERKYQRQPNYGCNSCPNELFKACITRQMGDCNMLRVSERTQEEESHERLQ